MINQEFFAALNDLVKEKGISRESFIETLQNALASAYKKQYDNGAEISVELDPDSGNIEFLASRSVVAESSGLLVFNPRSVTVKRLPRFPPMVAGSATKAKSPTSMSRPFFAAS